MKKKPVIKIHLKPHLEDFIRHEMRSEGNNIILTRHTDIGKYIYSHITEIDTSNYPMNSPEENNKYKTVSFTIPCVAENHYICRFRFCGVSRWAEQKINDYLETEFKQRVRLLFEAGYKRGFKQKDIVEAILDEYNIRNSSLNFDTIKKYDYRNNRKTRKIIYHTLQSIVC